MNILFAPINIASMPLITAEAINRIEGYEAKCLSIDNHKYHKTSGLITYSPIKSSKENIVMYILERGFFLFRLYKLLKWCDVVHWTWDSVMPFNLDLRMIKWMKKPRFIEWVGSDIRNPEVTMRESKWYKAAFNNGYEHAKSESEVQSHKIQRRFSKYGFVPILVPEMQLFLIEGLFKKVYTTQYRIDCDASFKPEYPKVSNQPRVCIVHSPSAVIAKGSNIIIPIVEELKQVYSFLEFRTLHNVSRDEVLKNMKECDVFIDQIILGSYASAAIEAMCFGKPVLAYIMPSVYKMGIVPNCPVVNVNADTLKETLINLIENPLLRNQIGKESRKYAEAVHDADVLSKELSQTYTKEIGYGTFD